MENETPPQTLTLIGLIISGLTRQARAVRIWRVLFQQHFCFHFSSPLVFFNPLRIWQYLDSDVERFVVMQIRYNLLYKIRYLTEQARHFQTNQNSFWILSSSWSSENSVTYTIRLITKQGHVRVVFCLSFKTSPRAKPFKWKWVRFAWKWTCN